MVAAYKVGGHIITISIDGDVVRIKDVMDTNENHKQASYCLTCDKTVHDVILNLDRRNRESQSS